MSNAAKREATIACLIELLRKERLRQKLSLNEVAARSGLSHTMVMRVEKRERLPTIDTLLRIADAMEADLGILLAAAIRKGRRKK